MSIGDIKGARRRFKALTAKGHAPKRSSVSVSQSIERNRAAAARLVKLGAKKKK